MNIVKKDSGKQAVPRRDTENVRRTFGETKVSNRATGGPNGPRCPRMRNLATIFETRAGTVKVPNNHTYRVSACKPAKQLNNDSSQFGSRLLVVASSAELISRCVVASARTRAQERKEERENRVERRWRRATTVRRERKTNGGIAESTKINEEK